MKNNKVLLNTLITILSFSTLVGCDNTSTSSSTSSSSLITSSVDNSFVPEEVKLERMIENLSNGVTLEGVINGKLNLLDSYKGQPTGEVKKEKYEAEFIYEINEENGYSAYVTYQEENKEALEYINYQLFEGRDGYTYYYDYNYDNTIVKYPIYSNETGEKVPFGYSYLNPFDFLIPSDFTKVNDTTYELDKAKASFLSLNIFPEINGAFANTIKKCEFTVENGQFKSFTLVPTQFHNSYTDLNSLSAVYYYADYEANFEFKNLGSSKVYRPEPKKATEHTAKLQAALAKFEDKNFTAHLYARYTDQNGELIDENFEYTYYDGEEIYMSFTKDQSAHDADNNSYCRVGSNGLLSVLGVKYEDAVPKISEVDAAIFDYDEVNDVYKICKEMESYIGVIAFVPLVTQCNDSYALDGLTTQFDIKLDENGDIDYIEFAYDRQFALSAEYANMRLEYYDVGTTKIPHNQKIY